MPNIRSKIMASSSRSVATLITGSFSLALLVSHFVLLLLLIDGKRQVHASSPQRLLNYCLDSKYHKSQPSSEPMLKDQCRPWAQSACCTANVTESAHLEINHYNFDPNHCEVQTNHKMSGKCMQYFIRDTCFFDCEPNIGAWVEKVNRSFATERFKFVPLCASECDAWFDACKDDYTCTHNWSKGLSWRKGRSKCKQGSSCRRISEVFATPKNFCESVWDDSFSYVPDTQPCMRLTFDPRDNPNRRAAKNYLSLLGIDSSSKRHTEANLATLTLSTALLLAALINLTLD